MRIRYTETLQNRRYRHIVGRRFFVSRMLINLWPALDRYSKQDKLKGIRSTTKHVETRRKRFTQVFSYGRTLLLTLSLLVLPILTCAEDNILRLLVWEGYAPEEYVQEFETQIEEKYGRKVKLQVSYVDGPEDFFAPVRQKNVDLVTLTHHYFKDERFDYIEKGMLLPIEIQNLSNFKAVIPALQKADFLSQSGNLYGVPVGQGPYGLAYSVEKAKIAPESWQALWSPEYRGKYVLGGNEYLYNISMTALAWGYPAEALSNYDMLNNMDFKEKLRELAMNAHSFWIGIDTPDDLAGKSLATVWGDSLGKLKKQGEVWELAEPREGTLSWIDSYAITWALADKPFLKKVAEEWINRLLEPDYQADHIVREVGIVSTTTNIAPRLTAREKEKLHIGTPDFFKDNRILLPTFSNRDRNGFMLLWKEAMQGRLIEDDVD